MSIMTEATLQEQRQAAEVALSDAQQETQAVRAAIAEVESKITAEQNFRSKLNEKLDAAALSEQEDAAQGLQQEIGRTDFRLRGLELRLANAKQELAECEAAERPLAEEVNRLACAEQSEREGLDVKRKVERGERSYQAWVKAGDEFLAALTALKETPWSDPAHANAANNAWFSLQSRLKGYRY